MTYLDFIEPILQYSALILSIINGLILIWAFTRDRPKLIVEPGYPETYQWFFSLPPGNRDGQPTRKFGFLAYIDIINTGIRDVQVKSWILEIKTINGQKYT